MAFNVLAGMQHVQSGFKEGKQEGERNRFASLTDSAMAGDPNAMAQQYAINPQQAAQVQQGADLTAQKLRGAAKYMLETNDPAVRQGRWNAVRPMLARIGQAQGKVPPEQWDDSMVPMIEQALAKTAYLESGTGGNPAQLQTFNAMTQGLSDDEIAKARRIQLGLDGRASNAGQQTISVTGPDGRDRQFSFDPTTGNYVPAGLGIGQSQPQPAAPTMQQVQYATSDGQAIPPEDYAAVQAAMQASERGQYVDIPAGGPIPAIQPAQSNMFTSRAPEAEAAAVTAAQEQAKRDAEFGNYDRMTDLVADRASAEARAKAAAEDESRRLYGSDEQRKQQREASMKLPQLQEVTRLTERISGALDNLNGAFVNTGPADQWIQALTPEGQALSSATGAIQNSMLALTRVPGVGSQSDLEARVANLKYPQLGLHPSVNRDRLADLQAFVRDLNAAYQNVMQGGNNIQTTDAVVPAPRRDEPFQGFRVLD